MSNHIIDLTVDSEDDECDFYHINPILVPNRVASLCPSSTAFACAMLIPLIYDCIP